MGKNKHLTLSDRTTIEVGLKSGLSFKQIARDLGKDPTTISKEVRCHIQVIERSSFNPCARRRTCTQCSGLCSPCNAHLGMRCKDSCKCYKFCPNFVELTCERLTKPPYVCYGCTDRRICKLRRHVYEAQAAQAEYEVVLSESRKGLGISPEDLKRIDEIVSPLVKQGQSIHHICVNNADLIMLDEKTIYNYIDAGLLSVGNIDLPRKVRYRVRPKKKTVHIDKKCYVGRTYTDFEAYIAANPDLPIVEMDSVEGRKGGKVLLTMYFRTSSLMLAFIRDANTARSVTEIFSWLYKTLGHEMYCKLFPVILADRGSEFSDPMSIEYAPDGEQRSHMFYCDPNSPHQKGGCEVTHEFIRRVLPKGTSFDHLNQEDILLMMSHINSYSRNNLNDKTSFQVFSFLYGDAILPRLGITEIPANDVTLKPYLLKKK